MPRKDRDQSRMKASSTVKDDARPRTSARRGGGTSTRAATTTTRGAREGRETARSDRTIQQHAEARREQRRRTEQQQARRRRKSASAVQPAEQTQPAPPFPAQHLEKPGQESELQPAPQYEAPTYKGSGKLQGKVALITGGDSGIGRGVAVLYAREGADVAIVYLSEDADARETQRAVEAEGRRALLIPGDVTDFEFCRQAVERTVQEFGHLDILVNNAAFQEHAESLEDISEEHFDRTVKTNLYGYFHMAKAALPHLGDGSAIVNTGSVTGIEGSKHLLDYSATKGAIHAFTKSLAQNLVDQGIRVNAVAPGPVWTPLNPADRNAKQVSEFGASVPMQRPAQPEEIAPAYVFLAASSDSSYITGEVLPILGGKTV